MLLAGRCATWPGSITIVKDAFGAGTPLSRQWYAAHRLARSVQRARVRALRCDGARADSVGPHFWQDAARDLLHVWQWSWALSASKFQGTWGMAASAIFRAFFMIRFWRIRCSTALVTSTRVCRGRISLDRRTFGEGSGLYFVSQTYNKGYESASSGCRLRFRLFPFLAIYK